MIENLYSNQDLKYSKNLLNFAKQKPNKYSRYHPTAKPVELIEYLVKTYTKEGDVILDFCAGGGSLLQACKNLNRKSRSILRWYWDYCCKYCINVLLTLCVY